MVWPLSWTVCLYEKFAKCKLNKWMYDKDEDIGAHLCNFDIMLSETNSEFIIMLERDVFTWVGIAFAILVYLDVETSSFV